MNHRVNNLCTLFISLPTFSRVSSLISSISMISSSPYKGSRLVLSEHTKKLIERTFYFISLGQEYWILLLSRLERHPSLSVIPLHSCQQVRHLPLLLLHVSTITPLPSISPVLGMHAILGVGEWLVSVLVCILYDGQQHTGFYIHISNLWYEALL